MATLILASILNTAILLPLALFSLATKMNLHLPCLHERINVVLDYTDFRALVEFRTRKAHRWVVREKDILRYLSTIICVVLFYMGAWTTVSWPFPSTIQCLVTGWHRLTEIGIHFVLHSV